ncbi:class I SAM-dependent methyltransferase [Microbacterium hominis]|uniref:Class I SAM-dependent methyltransferase n=1 Tax=Microbacterium hominis TaxID=162426 RepID=A0A7D4Q0M3_9MICO|nr:class I SAM-dependent methyltransferase [Microbacterium hominis]QKJ19078.1 class I SAM-dependent methyltransferase [Microbacterium hominis]
MASREEMSLSFGAAAAAYESGRPDYPRAAVEWMLAPVREPGRSVRAADVGAGTGKLTRAIVEIGADVVAIDPDADMLAALRARVHGVPTFVGAAERLPLPDAALDAVLIGQAWHWVDAAAAAREVARVLRAGGVLGLVWNIRDESDPWVARLSTAIRPSNAERMLAEGGPRLAAPFGRADRAVWRWTNRQTRAVFLDMVASRSHVITAPEAERARILSAASELFDERCRLDGSGLEIVEIPYRTEAYRAVRP